MGNPLFVFVALFIVNFNVVGGDDSHGPAGRQSTVATICCV